MKTTITQQQAADLFDLPEILLYVCDGRKECRKPSCLDHSLRDACHHTADESHALYSEHDLGSFGRLPAVRDGEAAVICVEPIR